MAAGKNGITILKDYNIDKIDLFIYGTSLVLLLVAIFSLVFIAGKDKETQTLTKVKSARLNVFKTAKSKEAKIKGDFANLPVRAQGLYDGFLAQDDVNTYAFFVKTLADKFKANNFTIDPGKGMTATESRVVTVTEPVYQVLKKVLSPGIFDDAPDGGKKFSLKFVKLSVRVTMELSFGNLVAFLYAIEHSSKYTEVAAISIAGTSDVSQKDSKVRVDMVINCFGRSEEFKKQVFSVLPPGAKLIESQNKVLVQLPSVSLGSNPGAQFFGRNENIDFGDKYKTVHPVFYAHTTGEIQCPQVIPANLRYSAIVGDTMAFTDGTTTFFGKTGGYITSKGKPIQGFEKLVLKEINSVDHTVTIQNQGINKGDYPDCPDSAQFKTR